MKYEDVQAGKADQAKFPRCGGAPGHLYGDAVEHSDLPQLVKAITKALKLLPDDIPEAAKGAESIQRIPKNPTQITQGLGELRKHYGTGHGRSGSHRGLSSRHARLAVGATAAFIEFIVATHKERLAAVEKAA